MIIDSWMKLEIGKIYNPLYGFFELDGKEYRDQDFRFLVIREATEEEYHKENIKDYGKTTAIEYGNIYEISVD